MFTKPFFSPELTIKVLTTQAQKIYKNYQEDKKGLQEKAFKVAYTISMPLLANAQTLNQKDYDILLPNMVDALGNLQNKSLAAWLWGRVYAAARHIGDAKNAEIAKNSLKTLLDSVVEKDAFIAWAWGYYLADENNGEYKSYKETMFSAASNLTANSTDAMWAWVMAIQAAANNADDDMYTRIKDAMLERTGQTTIDAALNKGLTDGDYPAWAKAIVYAAALKIKDLDLVNELSIPVNATIQRANNAGNVEEFMLADLTLSASPEKSAKISCKIR